MGLQQGEQPLAQGVLVSGMRNTTGASWLLLLFGVAWPSGRTGRLPLRAHNAPGRRAAHLDRLARAGALSRPIDEADPPAPVSPCAGMRCSNDPAPAPPAAPRRPAAEQWGYLADLASGPDITSSPSPGDDPAVRPRHRGASPFHPPR